MIGISKFSYHKTIDIVNAMVLCELLLLLMIFTIAKLLVFWLLFENAEVLITFSMNVLSVFKGHANLELFFVMMVYPFILNCA